MKFDYQAFGVIGILILIILLAAGLTGFAQINFEDFIQNGSLTYEEKGNQNSEEDYRTITDMAGRNVTIPKIITKVLSTSTPPSTYAYILTPEKLDGWQLSLSEEGMKYISEEYRDIPTVGQGSSLNYEDYIERCPDLVFVMIVEAWGEDPSSVDLIQEKFGSIPVVCVTNPPDVYEYDDIIRFMGDILSVPDVAKTKIEYYNKVLEEVQKVVSSIPEEERVRVYYAEGSNGLKTDPSGSYHSQLIEICGGINVAECEITTGGGQTEVTKESVLKWSPDLIITTNSDFYNSVFLDNSWSEMPAIRTNQVYLAPKYPFNWFDRPAAITRIVGIPWTAHILYPDKFSDEWLNTRVKEFFSIYYHYQLNDDEIASLMDV